MGHMSNRNDIITHHNNPVTLTEGSTVTLDNTDTTFVPARTFGNTDMVVVCTEDGTLHADVIAEDGERIVDAVEAIFEAWSHNGLESVSVGTAAAAIEAAIGHAAFERMSTKLAV